MRTQQGLYVPNGKDRLEEELMIWGVIPLLIKISTDDTDGALFVFEHADMGKGGPRGISTTSKTSGSTRSRATSPSRSARSSSRCVPVIRCSRPAWSRTCGRTLATTRGHCSWPSSPPVRSKRASERVAR